MAENSKIEWCDHTFNPWIGCTKVSPACDHCYAEAMMDTRYGRATWGPGEDRVRTSPGNWKLPLRWNRAAEGNERPVQVFCASLADVFDNEAPEEWRRDLFELIEATPNLTWLLLTKRIGNVRRMTRVEGGHRPVPVNAAIGATMANQEEWDRDMPKLREVAELCGPRFIFASVEPMLDRIDVGDDAPDWIICGGESGKGARDWDGFADDARHLRDQAATMDRAFFMKQMPHKAEIPADLLVREFVGR